MPLSFAAVGEVGKRGLGYRYPSAAFGEVVGHGGGVEVSGVGVAVVDAVGGDAHLHLDLDQVTASTAVFDDVGQDLRVFQGPAGRNFPDR